MMMTSSSSFISDANNNNSNNGNNNNNTRLQRRHHRFSSLSGCAGNPNEGDNYSSLPLHQQHDYNIMKSTYPYPTRIKRAPRRGRTTTGVGTTTAVLFMLCVVVGICLFHRYGRQLQTTATNTNAAAITPPPAAEDDVEGGGVYYDVAIAGSGPSGLTAALFAARAGLNVIVLGSATGLLSETKHLDNFPSFAFFDDTANNNNNNNNNNNGGGGGPSWLQTTKGQAANFGAHFAPPGLLATSLRRQERSQQQHSSYFELTTSMETYRAWSVIIASGAQPKKLGLSGEDKLWGTSLHSCAICDGHLYRDRVVLVVGGGDAAMDAAILLSRQASRVVLVHRRDEFSGNNQVSRQVAQQATPNVAFKTPFVVKEWKTSKEDPSVLIGAKLQNVESNAEEVIDISGAFVMIGAKPNTDWLKPSSSSSSVGLVKLDQEGLIELMSSERKSNNNNNNHAVTQSTTTPGIFACGEVTDNIYKQAITASAAGAQAAIDAERWLRESRGARPHHHRIDSSNSPNINTNAQRAKKSSDNHNEKTKIIARDAQATSTGEREEEAVKKDDTDDCDLTKQDCITSVVQKYPVVVFSKPWCPYCRKALEALSLAGVTNSHVIDLSTHHNAQTIQSTLQRMTGRRTVPNLFVGGSSIGGGDETAGLQRSGRLVPLLQERGALSNHQETEQLRDGKEEEVKTKTVPVHENNGKESCDLLEKSCFEQILQQYPAVMFSLSWCPECHRELELLERVGAKDKVHIIDLDDYKPISHHIRSHMLLKTGRRQVPNLFVGGEFVGGFQRTSQIHEQGGLVPLFEKVGLL